MDVGLYATLRIGEFRDGIVKIVICVASLSQQGNENLFHRSGATDTHILRRCRVPGLNSDEKQMRDDTSSRVLCFPQTKTKIKTGYDDPGL
jgi:hypothetical protein